MYLQLNINFTAMRGISNTVASPFVRLAPNFATYIPHVECMQPRVCQGIEGKAMLTNSLRLTLHDSTVIKPSTNCCSPCGVQIHHGSLTIACCRA